MIKRIRLLNRAADQDRSGPDLAAAWRATATAAQTAPPDARPLRSVLSVALPEVIPDPPHDAVALEWFADTDHLARFGTWLASPDGAAAADPLVRALAPGGERVVLAEEHIGRGADWLDRRWRDGGPRLKQMAIARRADGLTPEAFSDRWRSRAGQVGAVRIPDEARGTAYVQNHPLRRPGDDWPYDAVNEVYFDDLDGLRTRIAWFAEHFGPTGEDDLVSESWFVALREETG